MSYCFFFFKQKTAYEMRISDWSSDVCSSDLRPTPSIAGATTKDSINKVKLLGWRVDVEVRVGNHKAKSLKILVDLRLQLSPMLLKFFEVSLDALHRHGDRSEEHTSELQSLMRISYDVFCLKQKTSRYTIHI